MLASPACQGHSHARGKDKVHHDACRSTAWAVVSCAEIKRPRFILVENVPEFYDWTLFKIWEAALRELGYRINTNIFNAADFGVPQNRERAFIFCSLEEELALCSRHLPHTPASKIVKLFDGTWSQVDKPGRAESTLTQISNGRLIHGNRFLVAFYGREKNGRSLHKPIGTITTRDRFAVVNGDRMRMLTIAEAQRAMGFPDSYKLPGSKKLAMHFLGNAVCPPVAADLITQISKFV
jgi:DNA (cytosine-5)-methyltransferase 1